MRNSHRSLRGAVLGILLLAGCVSAQPTELSSPTPPSQVPPSGKPSGPTLPPPAATDTPASGPLVEAAFGNLSTTLHPYPDSATFSQAWLDVAALIWGRADGGGALLAYDWDALDYRPAMATQLPRVSSSGKTFTFTLRQELRWSDGSPITVGDFLFAYDQAGREDNRYVQLDLVQDIATYRAPDSQTLEVTLKDSRPRDVALAIANVITPVPRRVWSGRSWTDPAANPEILHPSVVLGPFKVESMSPGDRATFVPVTSYYVGAPMVPKVELLANQGTSGAYEALKAGRVNWVRALPADAYEDAKADSNLEVKEWSAANAAYRTLEFNLARPLLADKRVRQALALAVNRADLIAVAEQGLGEPQYSFVQPSNTRWVNGQVDRYDFDFNRARQLLRDAGYQVARGGLVTKEGLPVRLQVVYPTSSASRARIAGYLQRQYALLGVEAAAVALDFSGYVERVQRRRDFDISLAAYGGGSPDPDLGPKAQLISNGQQNVTGYSNPQVDELFRQASSELDPGRRKQLYDQAQALVNADLPSHYLYALTSVDAFSSKVSGVVARKGDRLDYNSAILTWSVSR